MGVFDNDGDLDFIVAANNIEGDRTQIWRNNHGIFEDAQAGLQSLRVPRAPWIDFDQDGDLDAVLTGIDLTIPNFVTRIARNDSGFFIMVDAGIPGIRGVPTRQPAWGDYNGDGMLDFALVQNHAEPGNLVWRGLGNGNFAPVVTPSVLSWEIASSGWGDWDQDGDLDLIVGTTVASGQFELTVLQNNAANFELVDPGIHATFPVSSVDADSDGDLDILTGGILWMNEGIRTNKPPSAPSGLSATVLSDRVELKWSPATDPESPSTALSYNIRIGTGPGLGDVMPSHSLSDGRRLIPEAGNHRGEPTAHLELFELPPGTYYWSVQAVDPSFTGGPFSTESMFEVENGPAMVQTGGVSSVDATSAIFTARVNSRNSSTRAWIEYGLSSSFGLTTTSTLIPPLQSRYTSTRIFGLLPGQTYHYRGGASNAFGTSRGQIQTVTTPWFSNSGDFYTPRDTVASWGDADGDGRLDLTVMDWDVSVYRNQASHFPLLGALAGTEAWSILSMAWSDIDNDNRVDLIINRYSPDNKTLHAWKFGLTAQGIQVDLGISVRMDGRIFTADFNNDGAIDILSGSRVHPGDRVGLWWRRNGAYFKVENAPGGSSHFKLFPGDYDADGDLDFIMIGIPDFPNLEYVRLFRNDQGIFVPSGIRFPELGYGEAAWADFDGDGDLDIALSGDRPREGNLDDTRIYRNEGAHFVDIGIHLPRSQHLDWADFNGDGWYDLCLASGTGIWLNLGGSGFSPMQTGFPGGKLAIADFDEDGDLDVWAQSRLWKNEANRRNTPPTPPTGLRSEVVGSTLQLHWTASTDAETPGPSLRYVLRVGTAPGTGNVVSPQSDLVTGKLLALDMLRMIPGTRTYLTLYSLPEGTCYWSVQAVDAAGGSSSWAAEESFAIADYEGDVNPRSWLGQIDHGDRTLSISDWVQAGRFVAGLDPIPSPRVFQRIDCAPRVSGDLHVRGDGRITLADWVQAGRYAAGLDPITPVAGPSPP